MLLDEPYDLWRVNGGRAEIGFEFYTSKLKDMVHRLAVLASAEGVEETVLRIVYQSKFLRFPQQINAMFKF